MSGVIIQKSISNRDKPIKKRGSKGSKNALAKVKSILNDDNVNANDLTEFAEARSQIRFHLSLY